LTTLQNSAFVNATFRQSSLVTQSEAPTKSLTAKYAATSFHSVQRRGVNKFKFENR